MKGLVSALYSALAYAFFLAVFLYAIGFVEGVLVPKTLDSGTPGPFLVSLMVDLAVLGVFAVQHSVMARSAFKRAWTRVVPERAERSTYVLASSLALALIIWQWRPLTWTVWSIENPAAAAVVTGVSFAGWGIVLVSTFLISHFHLFGLSQGFARMLGLPETDTGFATPSLYRLVRHPIYAGFVIAFWAAPTMSLGHLVFAVATTGYILIGIWLEERDLVAQFGARYLKYREQVGMLFPRLGGKRASSAPRTTA